MKQILQNLKNGKTELAELPVPNVRRGCLLIQTSKSLISLGTERMLVSFGKANLLDKARQQPDKVKQVIRKAKTDGVASTVNAVLNKLDTPLPLGYSNAGVVIGVGSGVQGFKVGDKVASNGHHAEVVCVPAQLAAKVPEGVDDETAAFTVVSAIALEGVRLLNPTLGESVAVLGLGLVGLLTCQLLAANGCRVLGFDFDEEKVALAREFGAEAYCLGAEVDPVSVAMEFSQGHGVDGVIIAASTASNDPISQAPQMCRKRGRVILVGVTGLELSRDDFYKKEISFQVSCSYGPGRYEPNYEEKGLDYPIGFVRWTEQRNFEAVLNLMAQGKLQTKRLVTKVFDIENAQEAYELVSSSSTALGLILNYSQGVDLTKKSVILKSMPNKALNEGQKSVVGVIGAGNFASGTLIPAFAQTGAVLKTIASAGGVTGNHLGRKLGFSVATTDHSRIMNDPEINTVVIATRHSSHASLIAEALNKGKHVYCEKPAAMTLDEVTLIEETYHKSLKRGKNLQLMIGYNRRFSPLIKEVIEKLKGCNGPRSIIITANVGAIPPEHWVHDPEIGGGRVLGEGCHFIDLIRHLTNSPIVSVNSIFMENASSATALADTATVSVVCANGSIGTVHYFANGSKDFAKERVEVFVDGKIMQVDNFKNLSFYGFKGAKNISLWAQDKGHKNCVQAFVDAIEKGGEAPIAAEEIFEVARASLRAVE
jgi:predicted dehydrogenase/threonine dehydrogenase-like Zn-dependent dehydrogenase